MMARCANSLFYKIICLSLLGIAVTFTIILTNVFVDIDNLIFTEEESESVKIKVQGVLFDEGNVNEQPANEDNDTSYNHNDAEARDLTSRTRRSVSELDNDAEADSNKDSKSMSALTNKIVKLLEDMDEADSSSTINYEEVKFKTKTITPDKNKIKQNNNVAINETPAKQHNHAAENNKKTKDKPEYDFLHLGMHNILLNGIINHADLTNVFKKVHYLIESFSNMRSKQAVSGSEVQQQHPSLRELNETKAIKNQLSLSAFKADEQHIFNELINCSKLKQDLAEAKLEKEHKKIPVKEHTPRTDTKLVIKTIIDIKDDESEENTVYFTKTSDKPLEVGNEVSINKESKALLVKLLRSRKNMQSPETKKHDHQTRKHLPKAYLDELLSEYFNNFNDDDEKSNVLGTGRRPKRETEALEYSTTTATITGKFEDKDYQDLYVEIDTHFKNHDLKSDKKKQIINSFIKKIENALHYKSDMKNETQDKVQVKKQVHVRKRLQYPYTKNMTKSITEKSDTHSTKESRRKLNHIDKTITNKDPIPQYADDSGSKWSKKIVGPTIFTGSKSINSAEMHEVDVDFHQVSEVNGIPQRLQQPLQPSNSGEGDTFRDLGNVRFVVNDLEGSGLSIGFNQYTDAPPDPSVINVFTGLNDLINTYQNNYTTVNDNSKESNEFRYDGTHNLDKRYTSYKDYFSNNEDEDSKEVTQNDAEQLLWNIFKKSDENEDADIFSMDDNTIMIKNNLENKRKSSSLHQPTIINHGGKVKLRKFMSKRSNINELINPRKKREMDYLSELIYPNPTSELQEHYQHYDSEEMPSFKTDNETRVSETPINTNEMFQNHNTDYLLSHYPHTGGDEVKDNLMTKIPFKIKIHAKNANKDHIKKTEPFDNPKDHIPELDDLFSRIGLPGKNIELSIKSSSHNDSSSSGYKETHTTINKTYKKNGVNVITLFNVSHVSKVEKQNDSIVHLDNSLNTVPTLPIQNIIDILNGLSTNTQHSTVSVVTEPYFVEPQVTDRPTKDKKTTFVSGEQPMVHTNPESGDVKISVVEDELLDKLLHFGNHDDGPEKLVKMIVPTSPPVEIFITKEQFEKISFNWVNDKLRNPTQDTQVTHTHETTTELITTTVVPTTEPDIPHTTHKHTLDMLPMQLEEQLMFSSLLLNKLLVKLDNNTNVITKLLGMFKSNPDTRRSNHNPKPPHKNLHVKARALQHFYIAKNSSFIPYIRCIHTHNNNHTHYIKQCHVYNTKLLPNVTSKAIDLTPKYSSPINTVRKN